jgi:glycosyltransferase involved in cell wall biosynthesis
MGRHPRSPDEAQAMTHVVVITQIPSPYQVEFFNHLASKAGEIDLTVVYIQRSDPGRSWGDQAPDHEHVFSGDGQIIEPLISSADRVILGWYRDGYVRSLFGDRCRRGRWGALWGERPGFGGWGHGGRLYRRWALRDVRNSGCRIWGIGEWAREAWRQEMGPRHEYLNMPYFSNLARFECPRTSPPDNVYTVLFSGTLSHRKGADLMASAFRNAQSKVHGLKLSIAGDGPMRSLMERELHSIRHSVTFHGFVDWQDLPRLYAQADVLCVPSRYDGWGLVVPEGLAAGLPVIATDKTGAALDLLSDTVNGFLIPAGDAVALEDALVRAAQTSSDQRRRMSAAAVKSSSCVSIETGLERFLEALEL